jgi:hypothetical protein
MPFVTVIVIVIVIVTVIVILVASFRPVDDAGRSPEQDNTNP